MNFKLKFDLNIKYYKVFYNRQSLVKYAYNNNTSDIKHK